jgi:dipeptidyl-peptidase-4
MKKAQRTPCLLGVFVILALGAAAHADQEKSDPSVLTLERIFAGRDFATERFGPARWMSDGETYTTLEASAAFKGGRDIVRCRADAGKREILVSASKLVPEGASAPIAIQNYEWSPDGKRLLIFTNGQRVWRQNTRGDFWVYDLATGRLRKLGHGFDPASLMFAKISPDGTAAAYVVRNDIYAESLDTGDVRRLTWDGSETVVNGTSDWVNEEEFGIRDGFSWSPDGRAVAFWQFDTGSVPDFTMINNTDSLYPRTIVFKYPVPGERNSACRVGIVPASGGYPVWMRPPGDPRETYIPRMAWAGNSREVVFQHMNRLQNENAVMIGDAATGETRAVFADRDDAWVEVMDDFLWTGGGTSFLWLSERDGWNHVYRVARDGTSVELLTPGAYDVLSIDGLDEKGGWLYVTASPEDATKRFLYRVPLAGGSPERVGPAEQTGVHGYQIAPSGSWAFHTSSTLDTPPMTELVRLPKGDPVRMMAGNSALRAAVEGLQRSRVEFFKVAIGDGLEADGWMIKPPDFDPTQKYPLLVYIYGEPAGQTVQDRWGGNTYLWHLMLAQRGCVVASFDNRGTPAPRGRAWRKSVYRQIGILASADQAAAVRNALAERPYLDPGRVGVWGWSGGGSMTLNAMFRYPEIYKTGISVASVPNQRLYDTIYQERYMGLPKDNEDGYKNGSPITFADRLKGKLLIVHGTGDDNVHYQGFEMLVNALVAACKQFAMLSYPNRTHGISEGRGTTLHLYTAFTEFLRANL